MFSLNHKLYSILMHKKSDSSKLQIYINEMFKTIPYFFACIMWLMISQKMFEKIAIW